LASIITYDATYKDWTLAIKEFPPAINFGCSRLASPPPTNIQEPSRGCSWDEEEGFSPALPVSPLLLEAPPAPPLSPVVVPESWGDAMDAEDLLPVQEDVASKGSTPSEVAALGDLIVRPMAPLLPCPTPVSKLPTKAKAQPTSDARRSARLGSKPKMHAMDKAVQVLNSKMGVAAEGVPLLEARKAYIKKFSTHLPNTTIDAFSKLFKLNIRSKMEADESLITMGGPGGCEPVAQDVSA
jgi:hypothetical protein